MIHMLNHGLNICILPIKIDTTKILDRLEKILTIYDMDRNLVRQRLYRYKPKYFHNKENWFAHIELLTVCLFLDPNYPNYRNHLGPF